MIQPPIILPRGFLGGTVKRVLVFVLLMSFPLFAQDAKQEAAPAPAAPANSSVGKLRILTTTKVSNSKPDDWGNTLSVQDKNINIDCASCTPPKLTIAAADINSLSYGEAAYHHWKAAIATGVLSLGAGAIVGFWPHHRHFLTLDLKDKNTVTIQADKNTYRQLATLLNSATGLPIEVSQKQVNDLKGIPVQVKMQ